MIVARNAAFAALILCSCEGIAQTGSADRVLESLTKCRAVPAADARLACFEQATAALEGAVRSKDVHIVDRQDIRQARRSLFGFTIPRVALFGEGDRGEKTEEPDFDEINTTIVSARSLDNNRAELRIADNDAVWVTVDPMPFPPKPGAKVRIRKGTLGTYFIAVSGERSVRGMRLR